MNKILFTTGHWLEHPPKSGPTLRIENSIKALSKVAEIVLISRLSLQQIGGKQALQYYSKYCSKFMFLTGCEASLAASRLIEIAHAEEVQVLWLGYGNVSYEILHHLKLQKCPYPIVIDTDSVWSRFVLRGSEYGDNLEGKVRIFSEGWMKRWEECWGTQAADITTAVSGFDQDYYKIFTGRANSTQVFSNVIDLENYTGVHHNSEIKKPCMYLAGTFWPGCPMAEAAEWVMEKVLPIVRQSIPNIHFYIIGNGATEVLKFRSDENVTITGRVESVLPYLSNADVALVPLKFESGTRFKIMEAGACNIPIVSTTLGAEGIPVTHGHDILLADTAQDFAFCIIELINNRELSRKLATNCRSLIESQYSITSAANEAGQILRLLGSLSFTKPPALDPGIHEISERLYQVIPNSDLEKKFAFSIVLFNHLMSKYANHPLFVLDEERREITSVLKQMEQVVPNDPNVKKALSLIQATGMKPQSHARTVSYDRKDIQDVTKNVESKVPKCKLPSSIQISLSDCCNFHCTACWIHGPKVKPGSNNLEASLFESTRPCHMDLEVYKNLINDIARNGDGVQIQFCGKGEPTINPHFMEMVELADDKGFKSEIVTNGSRLTLDMLQAFSKRNISINISLNACDSDSHKTYSNIDKDHFTRIVNLVRQFNSSGYQGLNISLSFVIGSHNIAQLADMANLATFILLPGSKISFYAEWTHSENRENNISRQQFAELLTSLPSVKDNLKRFDIRHNLELFPYVFYGISLSEERDYPTRGYYMEHPCEIMNSFLGIMADGRIVPCCRSSYVIGNINKQSIYEVLSSPRTKNFSQQASLIHKTKQELPLSHCNSCDHLMSNKYFYERYSSDVNNFKVSDTSQLIKQPQIQS